MVALPLSPACARAIAGGREDAPGLAAIALRLAADVTQGMQDPVQRTLTGGP